MGHGDRDQRRAGSRSPKSTRLEGSGAAFAAAKGPVVPASEELLMPVVGAPGNSCTAA